MYRYLLISFLCACLLPAPAFPQEKSVVFQRLLTDPALSATTVSWITQDRTGFLWLATENGLFRYDGYTFTHYQSDPYSPRSLSNDILLTVCTDRQGQVWSGSFNGLNQYHPDRDDFTRHYPDPAVTMSPTGNFIHRIAEDRKGTLWLATVGGLYRLDPGAGKPARFAPGEPGLSNSYVRSLLVDRRGSVWAGTERGLNRIDLPSGKVTQYLHDPDNLFSLSNNVVRSLYEDRQGNIWVGTEGGLNQLDPATGACRRYRPDPARPGSLSSDTVLSVLEDDAGCLWVGTWNGLNRREPGQQAFRAYYHDPADPGSMGGNTITALFADRTGTLWVGTNQGVVRLTVDASGFRRYFYSPASTKSVDYSVTALLEEDPGIYWLGTSKYLVRFDKARNGYRRYTLPNEPLCRNVNALAKDKSGTLWIGTFEGLFALRAGTDQITAFTHLISDDIWAMHTSRDGTLWIGTVNGLYQYDPGRGRLAGFRHDPGDPNSLSNNEVGNLLEDRRGNLWVGTARGGLNRLDRNTGRFYHYRHRPGDPASLSSDTVTSLLEDTRGDLWVGTGKALNRLDGKRGVFRRYLERHAIAGILEDNHRNLWLCYRDGISRLTIRTGACKDYGAVNGLQSQQYNSDCLRSTGGELLFAGANGLTVFHPDSVRDAPCTSLPPVITGFYLFNKRVSPGGKMLPKNIAEVREIALSYEQFIFAFEFSALHFGHADKSQYAYKLEGFEKEWNYTGNRRYAAYSNVPAGRTYTFRVKAADDGGGWHTPETAIRVRITPPFWQTPWFRAALAASLLGGVGLVYRVREGQHRRQRRELEEQVALRTVQISRQKEHIEQQAAEIDRINQLLRLDNRQLSENVKGLSQARVMQKRVTFEEFQQIYPDEEACLQFIAALKWKDGYACGKCGNGSYAPGPVPYSRRCSRCSTIERATTGTLFCRVRFPITKGFYMLFLLSQGKPLTVDELSEILSHPRQTCWAFRKKVLEAMEAAGSNGRSQDGWSHLIQQA